ncbi:MarR family winged helix-turn-helix transcriptional regulator [Actinomadura sp. LOL_016]|uniref:MarR family winged helix-turn-helix transcriptional regulator n=1 Tax=unclassified Actinomadura TaxID=2626254 RepID=UPI003A7FF1D2
MLLNRYATSHHRTRALERSAYVMLRCILVQGPMSIGQLGDALGLDPSTLNRQTAAAVHAGLLERIQDPFGGVARKFCVTDSGMRAVERERFAVLQSLEKLLVDWSSEDISAFASYLRRFNVDIERLTGRLRPGRTGLQEDR